MKTDDSRFIVTLPFPKSDLQGKEVTFDLVSDGKPVSGIGRFDVRTLRSGQFARVSILSEPFAETTHRGRQDFVCLTQGHVDKIETHPTLPATFVLRTR